jgi:hypothetical protein
MMVLEAVVEAGRVVVEVGQVVVVGGSSRRRTNVAKVLHPLKRTKKKSRQTAGIVVNPVTQMVRRSAHSGTQIFLPELALNMDNPIVGRLSQQPAPLVITMRQQNR